MTPDRTDTRRPVGDRAAAPSLDAIVTHERAVAERTLGAWLSRERIDVNVTDWVEDIAPRDDAPAGPRLITWSDVPAETGDAPGATSRDAEGRMLAAIAQFFPLADGLPHPHVLVWARSGDPSSPGSVARLAETALAPFRSLGASAVCAFAHGSIVPTWAQHGTHYKQYTAAPLALLTSAPAPPGAERVRVETPADHSYFPAYERMYESLWHSAPGLRAVIGPETVEDLDTFAACGGLRTVWIDGELAGVIGAIRHREFGMRGWRMRERVLGERHRGTGLGAAALWHFIRDLARESDDLLWGTIRPENPGSARSGERLGRVPVGSLVWITR